MQSSQQQGQQAGSQSQAAATARQQSLEQKTTAPFEPTATQQQAIQPAEKPPTVPKPDTDMPLQEALGKPQGEQATQGQTGGGNWMGNVQQAANLGATIQGLFQQNQAAGQQRVQSMLAQRQPAAMPAFTPTAAQFQQQADPRLQMLLQARGY